MINLILSTVIPRLLDALPAQSAKELIDDLLDAIEDKIEASENQIDDATLLPLIAKLREIASIPDDIGGDLD